MKATPNTSQKKSSKKYPARKNGETKTYHNWKKFSKPYSKFIMKKDFVDQMFDCKLKFNSKRRPEHLNDI